MAEPLAFADKFRGLEAIHLGHFHVGDQQVDCAGMGMGQIYGFLPAFRRKYAESLILQN